MCIFFLILLLDLLVTSASLSAYSDNIRQAVLERAGTVDWGVHASDAADAGLGAANHGTCSVDRIAAAPLPVVSAV